MYFYNSLCLVLISAINNSFGVQWFKMTDEE